MPSLIALQQGDPDAWDDLFDWLWPTAESVARLKLSRLCPEEVEDVAIQALETLVEKVLGVKTVEELKPLTASIAHNLAVSLLRKKFAEIHGGGKVDSLDARDEEDNPHLQVASPEVFLKKRYHDELKGLLTELKKGLKPEHRHVLDDFFKAKLTYLEISQKRGIPIGSVGVYLKRGLEAMREIGRRQPGLMKELEAFAR